MGQQNRTSLRKQDFLVLRQTKNSDITKVITPQVFQIGLDDSEFQNGLIVKGNIQADGKLLDSSGEPYIKGAGAISVTEDLTGGLTISATLGTGATLESDGTSGIEAFSYDGSGNQELQLKIRSAAGLNINSSLGLEINPSNAPELAATPASNDYLLIHDTSDTEPSKKITVSNLLSAASSLSSLGNPITFRDGLGNVSYSNAASLDVDISLKNHGGLSIQGGAGSGGDLHVDPSNAIAASALNSSNDYVLIYDSSEGDTRKTTLQKIANIPSVFSLAAGNGLSYTAGTSYTGGANSTLGIDTSKIPMLSSNNIFAGENTFTGTTQFNSGIIGSLHEVSPGLPYLVAAGGVTINTESNGQVTISSALGTGGTLDSGTGISTFSYDGTSDSQIAIDASGLISVPVSRNDFVISAAGSDLSNISRVSVGSIADSVDRTAVMVEGPGININFHGNSNPAEIEAKLEDDTLSIGPGGGLEVAKVPYELESGIGILPFIYDGSFVETVGVDNSIVATLTGSQFSGNVGITGSLEIESDAVFRGGLSGSLQVLADGVTPYIAAGDNVSIVTASNGQIIINSTAAGDSGGGGDYEYLVLSSTPGLLNERVLAPGTGILYNDQGAGLDYELEIDNSVVATLSGSQFTGNIGVSGSFEALGGITGSLQYLLDGSNFLREGSNITITNNPDGSITIDSASSQGDLLSEYVVMSLDSDLPNAKVLQAGSGIVINEYAESITISTDTSGLDGRNKEIYYVSASVPALTEYLTPQNDYSLVSYKNDFIDVYLNGALLHSGTMLEIQNSVKDYSITSNNSLAFSFELEHDDYIDIVVSRLDAADSGADSGAEYLVINTTGSLPNERSLFAGYGLTATDNGAGSSYEINIDDTIVATLDGSTFTGPVDFTGDVSFTGNISGNFPVQRSKSSIFFTESILRNTEIDVAPTNFSLANYENDRIDVYLNGVLLHSGTIAQVSSNIRDYVILSSASIMFSFELGVDDSLDVVVYDESTP